MKRLLTYTLFVALVLLCVSSLFLSKGGNTQSISAEMMQERVCMVCCHSEELPNTHELTHNSQRLFSNETATLGELVQVPMEKVGRLLLEVLFPPLFGVNQLSLSPLSSPLSIIHPPLAYYVYELRRIII